ncbi:MAG: acetylornithine transaminase [Thermodesulfobacteriota bacterium]|nr:acetylornithine transaminase [Thermodesulfobacteriota bacterium]
MSSKEIKDLAGEVIMDTYSRYDLALVRGEGARLYDAEGREYLDFLAGIAVANLGHAHPKVAEAVAGQARTLVHVSNLYYTEPQVKLAKVLTDNSFADRVFFCNSGAEANEAAIKLARKYSFDKHGPGRHRILSMENSFHGRTLGTLAATGQPKIHHGFEPLMEGFELVPFNNADALEKALGDDVCAVMIEPIQGEGGINEPDKGYLKNVASICRAKDVLLIFDEIQVGLGRTGKLFAYQNFGVEPNIMTLAKALANGLPIGAALARDEIASAFTPGSHATTFGGSPLVSAASLAVLETMLEPGFLDQVVRVGEYFKSRLADLASKLDFVRRVKGRGLILGIELDFPGTGVLNELMRRGFLINCTQNTILRFVPPLIITEAEVDLLMPVLEETLAAEAAGNKSR